MRKHFYIAFLAIFFLATKNTIKAADNQIAVGQLDSATPPSFTMIVDQYSESVSKDTLDTWVTNTNSFYLSDKQKGEFENPSFCPVNKLFCTLTLTNVQRRHLLLSSQSAIKTE